jgi:hypothetical protein
MMDIMMACYILYNMIIEDESGEDHLEPLFQNGPSLHLKRDLMFDMLVAGMEELENVDSHYSLRGDLMEHLWQLKGATTY